MKKIFTLCLVLIVCQPLFSQDFWKRANGPQGLNIKTLNYAPQGVFYASDYKDRTFRSVDFGLNWEKMEGPVVGAAINRLKVGLNGIIYCFGPDWLSIYRSTDLGETWNLVSNPFNSYIFTEAADGGFLIVVEGSILRTYDGAIWDTLFANPNPWSWDNGIRELGWLPDGTLVASPGDCYDSFSTKFFLLSQDNGSTWDSLPGASAIANLATLGNGEYIFSSVHPCVQAYKTSLGSSTAIPIPPNIINPEQENFVVTPSGAIIVSDFYQSRISNDGGDTWQAYDGNVYHSLSNHVLPGNLLIRGRTYSGNTMRSTNLGQTWEFSGYGVEDTWVFELTFKNTDKIFGLTSSGMWRSLDAGEHWEIVPQDSTTKLAEFSVYNLELALNGDLYLLQPYRLMRSTDDGETFQNISPDSSLGEFARVAIHPQTSELYLSGDSILAKSSNQGLTWLVLNTSIRFTYRPIVFHPEGTFYGIALKSAGGGQILVRSDDGGGSWQYVPLNPPYNHANDVQIAPDGKIVAIYSNGFFSSTDNGNTWVKRLLPTTNVAVLRLDAAGDAYVGSIEDERVFKTENNGASWSALPDLPSTDFGGVVELAFDSEQRLWACTFDDGHFKTLETTVHTTQPKLPDIHLEIFPNPSAAGFWVKWESEQAATLTLRDLCGRVVDQQFLKTSPTYIPVAESASGLYILELNEAGQRIELRKVFLR